jgi:hypothetical protein
MYQCTRCKGIISALLKEKNNANCSGMIYHKGGTWTYQDICDFEDCIDMWRFEKKGNRIFVKYPRKEKQ